jgi:SAM-dependent methyltransferase
MGKGCGVSRRNNGAGGYDDGYSACPCFWGLEPGSLVSQLIKRIGSVKGWRVLDAGCGEGKNADYLWRHGAEVIGVDVSALALANAQRTFPESGVQWCHADIRTAKFAPESYNLVLAYGLLHCLKGKQEITNVVNTLQGATRPNGHNILCVFNDRFQDLSAHPGFKPCLLAHQTYAALYADWDIEVLSDTDLEEAHPHNGIKHIHSMTRLIARKKG